MLQNMKYHKGRGEGWGWLEAGQAGGGASVHSVRVEAHMRGCESAEIAYPRLATESTCCHVSRSVEKTGAVKKKTWVGPHREGRNTYFSNHKNAMHRLL